VVSAGHQHRRGARQRPPRQQVLGAGQATQGPGPALRPRRCRRRRHWRRTVGRSARRPHGQDQQQPIRGLGVRFNAPDGAWQPPTIRQCIHRPQVTPNPRPSLPSDTTSPRSPRKADPSTPSRVSAPPLYLDRHLQSRQIRRPTPATQHCAGSGAGRLRGFLSAAAYELRTPLTGATGCRADRPLLPGRTPIGSLIGWSASTPPAPRTPAAWALCCV